MKVLFTHDYYRSSAPSGEDAVFHNERLLLESHGVEVTPFERFNDEIDDSTFGKRLGVALAGAWSQKTYRDLTEVIRSVRPEVAHFHNTFPLISPSAYAACQDNGVPVVQTLHNFRFICPGALLMRDGKPCEDCVGTSLMPALRHRCYRGSLSASSALAWIIFSNRMRGSYKKLVNRYVALTHFAASRLVAGGLPQKRMEIKPNFLTDIAGIGKGDGGYAVYVGRLSEEKGVRTLLAAWENVHNLPLKILGDGPLRETLQRHANNKGLAVEFLGFQPRGEILNIISKAALQVVPSQCYEGFPMVILEAYTCGTPVVASRIGSLDEIIIENETGVKFEAGNVDDLVNKVLALHSNTEKLVTMRLKARAIFDEQYTAEKNFAQLMVIYQKAIEDFNQGKRKH